MRRLVVFALALLIVLAPVSQVHAASVQTYYVATNGNDANQGSQAQPWKTISKAAATAAAGDTVIIGAGTYPENVAFSKSGTSGSAITFQGQNPPKVVQTDKSNTSCLSSGNSCIRGLVTIDGSQVVLKNMEVTGPAANPGAIAGITVKGSNDIIAANFVHNTWKEGIAIKAGTSNDQLLNNNVMYGVVSGIYFDGQNHLIQGNTITHSVTRPPDGSKLSGSTDPDGIRFFGTGTVVRGNVIKDIYVDESPESDAPHQDCFQTWTNVNGITFDSNYCELENSTTYSDPMEKFMMVERPNNSTGTVTNLKVINNIFVSKSVNTLWTPIQIGNETCSSSYPIQNVTIDNNTFAHTGNDIGEFAVILRCANTVSIKNNAIYNFGDAAHSYIFQDKNNNVNVSIANNAVYNTSGIIPKGGAYPGDQLASTWMKSPLFVNIASGDFHLQTGSPLIDAGSDLSGIVDEDYSGTGRPQGSGYDIGAYEVGRPVTISGNVGESGVTLTYSNGGTKSVTSDGNGDYTIDVPTGWSGTVTPAKTYHTFYPQNMKYSGISADQAGQDYTFEISTFADVSTRYWAWPQIEEFYNTGITLGCGSEPVTFCPDRSVTRAEIAVFILRSLHVDALPYTASPDPANIGVFTDVPTTGKEWMEPWIEVFYGLGISNGCGTDPFRYCPERQVTRAEIAVFVLRAIHGTDYNPPAVSGSSFSDVPVAGKEWMMPWIEEYYKEGLTAGCKQTPTLQYCPERSVTRAEIAAFIDRSFGFSSQP